MALSVLLVLAGCQWPRELTPNPRPVSPEARPVSVPAAAQPVTPPSAASRELATFYGRMQASLLAQGLLRTDGGGPDTPFDDRVLAQNFERIALSDEYREGAGLVAAPETIGPVKKWRGPVRVRTEFGASVPIAQREEDRAAVSAYVARLARITAHPISMGQQGANFHVFFVGEDDRADLAPRIRALVPGIDATSLSVIRNLPRSIHCLVIAFAEGENAFAYDKAIAVIRTEHPDLLRQSCVHEELAQGLGLANDSPFARPSIFNDDDEFAYLTTHDEMLLRILYDPRLTAGMQAETARPIIAERAAALMRGQN